MSEWKRKSSMRVAGVNSMVKDSVSEDMVNKDDVSSTLLIFHVSSENVTRDQKLLTRAQKEMHETELMSKDPKRLVTLRASKFSTRKRS